jgi:macrolide-specific efflux system membrane fusion protein
VWLNTAHCEEIINVPKVLVKLSQYVEASSLESGPLVEIIATEGLKVEAGELLARLDDTEEILLVEQAKITAEIAAREANNPVAVDSARRLLMVSQEELRRAKEAIVKFPDSISQAEIDRLDLAVDQAKLNLRKAEHEREQAVLNAQKQQTEQHILETKLARRRIHSSIAGTIVRVDLKRGEWVEPGKKIIRIVNLDRLRVEGVLDAKSASHLQQGMAVELITDETQHKFTGQLLFVSPEVDPFSQQVRIIAEVVNKQNQLRPGIQGTLVIQSKHNATGMDQVQP